MGNGEYLKAMGERIRAARQAKGYTLRQFGKMCSLDFGTLSRIENGQFNSYLLTIKNIADVLKMDVKDFI
mgnify:CR=1 FL=1